MRYPREQKVKSREKLVRRSASLAKQQGFAGSGVDALARAAGLTSGAFYRHFGGKAELLSAIVESEVAATRGRFASGGPGKERALLAIDAYLSFEHVRHPEAGCMLPSLAPEIARAPLETRTVFEKALAELQTSVAEIVGDGRVGNGELGSMLMSQCVGAVMLARGLATEAAQRELLAAARKAAHALVVRFG